MVATLFAMLVILALAAVVLGMVVVGMEGQGRHRLPEVAQTLARAGRHLNGEAEPPKGLVAFFEEAEDGADDLRQLPANIRTRATSRSSAGGPASAPSAARHEPPAAGWASSEIASTWKGAPHSGASAWGPVQQPVTPAPQRAVGPTVVPPATPARAAGWEPATPESTATAVPAATPRAFRPASAVPAQAPANPPAPHAPTSSFRPAGGASATAGSSSFSPRVEPTAQPAAAPSPTPQPADAKPQPTASKDNEPPVSGWGTAGAAGAWAVWSEDE